MRAFIFVLLFLMFQNQTQAGECKNTFFVSIVDIWPISYVDTAGQLQGLGQDLARALGQVTRCRIVSEQVPPFQGFKLLRESKTDMIMVNIENSGKNIDVYGDFIPILKVRRILVIRPDTFRKGWNIQNYVDDPKIRFAGVIGMRFAYKQDEIESLRKQQVYIETTDHDNLMNLIKRKGADATFYTEAAFENYRQHSNTADELIKIQDKKTWLLAGIYISKKRFSKDNLEKLESAIEKLRKSGQIQKMVSKYLEPDYGQVLSDMDLKRIKTP